MDSMSKPLHAGRAAQAGLSAAQMAAAGINEMPMMVIRLPITTGGKKRSSRLVTGAASAVMAPPAITAHPSSQIITLGSNVTFIVAATGAGPFTYQWRYNGHPIPGAVNPSYSIT